MGAWEGERQNRQALQGSREACSRTGTTLLSVLLQPRKLEENEGRELKTFYSPGVFFKKVLPEGHSHPLSGYLNNSLT